MEQFRPIKDFETYAISNMGHIKCLRTGTIKTGYANQSGYLQFSLRNPTGVHVKLIHRLVLETFTEKPIDKNECDHINRNRIDNRLENLRWVDDYEQSHNRGNFKNNKSTGHKYIQYSQNKTDNYSSYRIVITRKHVNFSKRFNSNKYTLEDVIKFRDEYLKENNFN
tara:strand:+ start:1923 stop:2423 length:501 start_codon:yes stop_codon:yes gene_type:complete